MSKIKNLFSTPKKAIVSSVCAVAVVATIGAGAVFATNTIAESNSIGVTNAQKYAFADAGITEAEVDFVRTEFDYENGCYVFDVEFYADGVEYDYTINAYDGTVIERESDIGGAGGISGGNGQTGIQPSQSVSADDALELALADAGLTAGQVTVTKTKLDFDDGVKVYDIEFFSKDFSYEYEIDAGSSEIISSERKMISAPSQGGTAASDIGADAAMSIALSDAGLTETDVAFTKVKLDSEDGFTVYDVEFITSSHKYEYEIDSCSGQITEKNVEVRNSVAVVPSAPSGITGTPSQETEVTSSASEGVTSQDTPVSSEPSGSAEISPEMPSQTSDIEKAKEAALSDAGLTADQVVAYTKLKKDYDDGREEYEIEFVTATHKYEYEIDAVTGAVAGKSVEAFAASGVGTAGEYIGADRAEEIALSHAGLTASDVGFVKSELDRDDGIIAYEVEFSKGFVEYEYKIDAVTGAVIEFESEYDD